MGEKIGWIFSDGALALFDVSNCDAAILKNDERISRNGLFPSTTLNSSSRNFCCIGC